MAIEYTPDRDGTIEDYIRMSKNQRVPLCFKGYEQFQNLVNLGYIEPNITLIRVMYNHDRGDEFYGVIDDFKLEGMLVNVHRGKEGIYNPEEILLEDTPYFEVDMVNPNPIPRK